MSYNNYNSYTNKGNYYFVEPGVVAPLLSVVDCLDTLENVFFLVEALCLCLYVCLCMRMYIHIHLYICVCTYSGPCACVHVCISIYMYVYVCAYM